LVPLIFGDGLAEDLIGSRQHQQVKLLRCELDALVRLDLSRKAALKVRQRDRAMYGHVILEFGAATLPAVHPLRLV
jgi:hypothetical protein